MFWGLSPQHFFPICATGPYTKYHQCSNFLHFFTCCFGKWAARKPALLQKLCQTQWQNIQVIFEYYLHALQIWNNIQINLYRIYLIREGEMKKLHFM